MSPVTVTAPAGCLGPDQRRAIAAAITRVHHTVTGAPAYYAQVIFHEVPAGQWFIGGVPLVGDTLYVHGHIRNGRSVDDKDRLITGLIPAVAEAAGAPRREVWVYLTDWPPRQMAEFGHVLPEAGQEAAWREALPPEDRDHLDRIGR